MPKEGDDLIVQSGWNIIYDLPVSPMYNMVEVRGQVTFSFGAPSLHLRCKYLFVRSGAILVGSSDNPFPGQALITLSGEKANAEMVYTNAIEAGNKILCNTGTVQMYGVPRDKWSRLTLTAYPGN